jgi:integrase
MEFLNKIFDERENSISDNSKKLYVRNLSKLNNQEKIINLNFLNDINDVIDKIKEYKPTTQRSYIISVCVVLKNTNKILYNDYYELLTKMNNDLKNNTTKSETQKKNWIDTPEILTIFNELKTKSKIKNNDQKSNIFNYMILALYFLQAPRRNIDYTLMKISSDMTDKNFNYLDLENKQFIFNNYKTKNKYETVKIDIKPDLLIVIKLYLSKHQEYSKLKNKKYIIHFLVNNSEINTGNQMTKILNKIFGGKNISSSMLRNIYLSNKYSNVIKNLKDDAIDMGTSVSTAMSNYIKE